MGCCGGVWGGEVEAVVYSWLIHTVVWEKPIQHCKAIILQLKISTFKKKIQTMKTKPTAMKGPACSRTPSTIMRSRELAEFSLG